MQEIYDEGQRGTRLQYHFQAKRLLDDPNHIVIQHQGSPVATLHGLQKTIGKVTFERKPASLCFGELTLLVYGCMRLVWTHAGAMCVLQGMTAQAVLGPRWLIISGTPTLPGDPRPGFWQPVLADIVDNPQQWKSEEIFAAVRKQLGLA